MTNSASRQNGAITSTGPIAATADASSWRLRRRVGIATTIRTAVNVGDSQEPRIAAATPSAASESRSAERPARPRRRRTGEVVGVQVDAAVAPGVGERRHGAEHAEGERLGRLVGRDQAGVLGLADERDDVGEVDVAALAQQLGMGRRRPARRRAARSSRRARRGSARSPRCPGGSGSAGRRRGPSPPPGPCAAAGASSARARRRAPAWSGSTSRRGPWRRRRGGRCPGCVSPRSRWRRTARRRRRRAAACARGRARCGGDRRSASGGASGSAAATLMGPSPLRP